MLHHERPRLKRDLAAGIDQEAIDHDAAARTQSKSGVASEQQGDARLIASADMITEQDCSFGLEYPSRCAGLGECLAGQILDGACVLLRRCSEAAQENNAYEQSERQIAA